VTAVAIDSDGALVASGSEDGTIVIAGTRELGPSVDFRLGSAVGDLAFSPDGRRLMAGADDGSVLIWDITPASSGEPRILKHPGQIRSAIFSPDGSHILAKFASSGVDESAKSGVWVWPLEGDEPTKIPLDPSCSIDPLPAFSPASDLIAIASCKAVQLWPLNSLRPRKNLIASMPHSVSFSSDGSRILVADELGVRLWSPEAEKVVSLGVTAKLAELSPDGSCVVIADKDGSIQVWRTDPPRREAILVDEISHLNSLKFLDNRHLLLTAGGSAFVQELTANRLPFLLPMPLDKNEKWRGVRDLTSFQADGLPAEKSYVPITSVIPSRDSSLIALGYADGRVNVVPGVDSGWSCDSRNDRLMLMTDLQIPVAEPESRMLLAVLNRLDGVSEIRRVCSAQVLSGGQRLRHAGTGEHITRARLLSAVANAVESAKTMLNERHTAILFMYISSHGLIGSDGAPYVLPADADANKPDTWVSFSQVLEPILRFMSHLQTDEKERFASIVIFDTCESFQTGVSPADLRSPKPQQHLIIVESAAPGQYAWHWTLASHITREPPESRQTPSNSTSQDRDSRATSETEFRTRISVLPVSSQYALSQLIKMKENASEQDANIMASEWVANVPPLAEDLQARIQDAEQTGLRQTVKVIAEPNEPDFPLFKVRVRQ
jgi:WD40 repeat protein